MSLYLGVVAHGPSLSGWGRSLSSGFGWKSYYKGAKNVLELKDTLCSITELCVGVGS